MEWGVFIYLVIYLHKNMHIIIINEKETMDVKENKNIECSEGRKGKDEGEKKLYYNLKNKGNTIKQFQCVILHIFHLF